jgi:AcrR family transcriptional regulator
VALLDQEGVEGLTMRRLAQGLGVTATALYWHVTTKEDVLDLAVDEIFGDVRLPDATDDWRADLRELVLGWRAAMLRHPWAAQLVGRPMLGPNVLTRTEFLQAALVRGGLDDGVRQVATHLLANFVIGAAATTATWRQSASSRGLARRHITDAYPTLVASGHLDEDRWNDDDLFERGLDLLLNALPRAER